MGWQDLLNEPGQDEVIMPWLGGRTLTNSDGRTWKIKSKLPSEFGWHRFSTVNRNASWIEQIDKPFDINLESVQEGYLVGDLFIPEKASANIVSDKIKDYIGKFKKVYLIEAGIDRFCRISVGTYSYNGPLIFNSVEMPIGPEDAVVSAFLDRKENLNDIPGVIPGLEAAFRIEKWRREEAERIRKEEEERREREERRRQLLAKMGTAVGRRELAAADFAAAARAALSISGSEYLDHRQSPNRNEMVVVFRLNGQKFECSCNKHDLRIIDAGICLTNEITGEKGDTWLTLESLPSAIIQAQDEGRLVIFRHVY